MPRPREVPNQLRGRPFTRSDAIQWGITGAMLRGKRFRRIFTGVYVEDRVPDSEALRFDAVRLIAPGCWATCHTAAGFYGFPVPPEPLTHIGLPAGATWPRDPRLRRHRHEGAPVIARVDGRPVSCPTDVFLRLAEHLSLLDLVIVGDAMVRRGRTTPRELVEITKQAGVVPISLIGSSRLLSSTTEDTTWTIRDNGRKTFAAARCLMRRAGGSSLSPVVISAASRVRP
jgi:hypothetical protein